MSKHSFLLGAADWCGPGWHRNFYPEDMPLEWRLAYYNTQFPCVWLPYAVWGRITLRAAEEWLNDTREGFRFLLEADEAEADHEKALLQILAPRLGLHCQADHPGILWFDSDVDLRKLSETLQDRAAGDGVTYLLSRDADLATLNKVDTLLGLLNIGPGGRVG
ncbi:MAG: hypothetical protein PHR30_17530 [Gallionellaceae bacterium]|nr:hypothetical protein [Gallionellaceae bacterium]